MSSFKSSENIQKKEVWTRQICFGYSIFFNDPEWTGNESQKNNVISNFGMKSYIDWH